LGSFGNFLHGQPAANKIAMQHRSIFVRQEQRAADLKHVSNENYRGKIADKRGTPIKKGQPEGQPIRLRSKPKKQIAPKTASAGPESHQGTLHPRSPDQTPSACKSALPWPPCTPASSHP